MIEVDPRAKWASINFINAATFKSPLLGIDQHSMWVYEVDGQYVEPQRADTIMAWAGERYSVMIKLDQPPQDYPIRVPDTGFTQMVAGYALLRYKRSGHNLPTQHEPWFSYKGNETRPFLAYNGDYLNNATTLDKDKLPPFPSWDPSLVPSPVGDTQYVLQLDRVNISWKDSLNSTALYPMDWNAYQPLLFNVDSPQAFDKDLVIRSKNGTWVDIVFQVGMHPYWPRDFPHPIHKHGSKVWQIGAGEGIYNYSSIDEAMKANSSNFNLINPPYRDTFVTAFTGATWIAIRYHAADPGPWFLHCHIESHLATGMAMAIMDGVDAWPQVPPEYALGRNGHR